MWQKHGTLQLALENKPEAALSQIQYILKSIDLIEHHNELQGRSMQINCVHPWTNKCSKVS
jgi:hypothetical protein